MVRDVLGSLLLLGGALWLWLGLVQAQRRQLRLLEELTELRRRLEQESRQREKLWFAGLFSGAGLLLILLI